jgi:hypothetical protein
VVVAAVVMTGSTAGVVSVATVVVDVKAPSSVVDVAAAVEVVASFVVVVASTVVLGAGDVVAASDVVIALVMDVSGPDVVTVVTADEEVDPSGVNEVACMVEVSAMVVVADSESVDIVVVTSALVFVTTAEVSVVVMIGAVDVDSATVAVPVDSFDDDMELLDVPILLVSVTVVTDCVDVSSVARRPEDDTEIPCGGLVVVDDGMPKADVIVIVVDAWGLKADDEVLDGSAAELVENI